MGAPEETGSSILICTSIECGNERILVLGRSECGARPARCVLCGRQLSSIMATVPAGEGRLLSEKELSCRSESIGWLTMEEVSRWPGPVH